MAKTLKTIGMVVGAVALVATGVGAIGGAAFAATAAGGTVASIATYAGIAAGVANIAATLAYKPPPARGSVARIIIDPDAPQPYVMGEGYFAGVLRHDTAYGATLKKVPNPCRFMVVAYSGAGPIESITPYVDQGAVPGWYTDYLFTDTQLGAAPEAEALAPQWAGAPGWGSTSKLSGVPAIGWSLLFDKKGKRFASGLPQLGAFGKWVKVYDPRLDSTYPGGSGSHRLGDETTYTWSENPALHAAMYAYGRYENGKRVLGVGMASEAIDWPTVVAWANVCDANAWTIFGVVFEPMPDTRWPNLKDIAAAGGGMPIFAGGQLTFKYSAPKVVLDTFTEDDLAEGPGSVTAMRGRRGRLNTIVPKYRSADHNWELVAAADAVSDAGYVTEDGEERRAEWPFNLVKDKDQAAALAAYQLVDGRELQPITLTFGVRVRDYKPGDAVHLDIPTLALDTDAVILTRDFDPARLTTTFTFIGETAAKHSWALGQTGTAPATPGLSQTAQERDELADAAAGPAGWLISQIRTAAILNPRDGSDTPRALLIGSDVGASATVSVARHDWDYPEETADVTRELATVTGLAFATRYYLYFDDDTLADTAPTYYATTTFADALNSSANPDRHYLGSIVTPADGAGDTQSEGAVGAGGQSGLIIGDLSSDGSLNIGGQSGSDVAEATIRGLQVIDSSGNIGGQSPADIGEATVRGLQVIDSGGTIGGQTPANIGAGVVRSLTVIDSSNQIGGQTAADIGDATDRAITGLQITGEVAQPIPETIKIGGVTGQTAANVSDGTARAITGLQIGGAVKPDKVVDGSIAVQVINRAEYVKETSLRTTTTSSTLDVDFSAASFSVTNGELLGTANIPIELWTNGPENGEEAYIDLALIADDGVNPSTIGDYTRVRGVWTAATTMGDKLVKAEVVPLRVHFTGLASGTWAIGFRVVSPSLYWAELPSPRILDVTNPRAME